MTDQLSLTNALADADIDRRKAERIATEVFDAIHDNAASRTDIDRLGTRIDQLETALGDRMTEGLRSRSGKLGIYWEVA